MPTPDPRAPGRPDQALVVGDWTGEVAARQEREALAYREADKRLREMHTELSKLRQRWAEQSSPCSAARAVAYQSAMGRVGRIIEDIERIAQGGSL